MKLALVVVAPLAALACSGSASGPAGRGPEAPPARPAAERPRARADSFTASRIALVPSGTFGPYVGDRAEGTIAAWAAEVDGKRRWLTVGLNEAAAPIADPKTVADAAPEVNLVAVRPLSAGDDKGFILLTSSREFSGERIDAMALGLRGELKGGPTPLAQSLGNVVWVDAVPTPTGAIAMWAVRHDDRAELFGVELGAASEVKDRPASIVSDVRSWQVAPTPGGVAVAVVSAGKNRGDRGPVRLAFVDVHGKPEKKQIVVGDGSTALPDLDLARIGDRLVLAWTDEREMEARLYGAVVDEAGTLVKPAAPLGRPFGPQAVVRLVAPARSGGPGFLAWENLIERAPGGRVIRLSVIGADGALGDVNGVVDFAAADGGLPELAATTTGVAALTLSSACRRDVPCDASRGVPTFVQFDKAFDVVVSEPLRLGALGGDAADLAWGLTCRGPDCLALAAAPASPAPVYAVKLEGLSNAWQPAGRRVPGPPPRAASVRAVGKSDSVADLAAARVGASSMVAWITYLDPATPLTRTKAPAPDGKYEAVRAVVRVRALPDKGDAPEPVILSYRGHSEGGVALSPGDPARGEALVAWAGIDEKVPRVFATLVGPDGKKVQQKMLSHGKGGVSDVATAYAGDGWVVAWIEESGSSSQVYATKVDRSLRPIAPERHLGTNASTATGVQLLSRGEHVFVVWSDARGPVPGVADVFAARLAAKDLQSIGPEHPVATTPAHSQSPAIAPLGEGAAVAWIEEPPPGTEGATSSLMVARLDSGAEAVAGSANALPLAGSPEGVGIACGASTCRLAASVTDGTAGVVDVLEWRPGGEAHPTALVRLPDRPRDAVAPALLDSDVVYADEGRRQATVRRIVVEWP